MQASIHERSRNAGSQMPWAFPRHQPQTAVILVYIRQLDFCVSEVSVADTSWALYCRASVTKEMLTFSDLIPVIPGWIFISLPWTKCLCLTQSAVVGKPGYYCVCLCLLSISSHSYGQSEAFSIAGLTVMGDVGLGEKIWK